MSRKYIKEVLGVKTNSAHEEHSKKLARLFYLLTTRRISQDEYGRLRRALTDGV